MENNNKKWFAENDKNVEKPRLMKDMASEATLRKIKY